MNKNPIPKKSHLLYWTRQGHKTYVGGEHVHCYMEKKNFILFQVFTYLIDVCSPRLWFIKSRNMLQILYFKLKILDIKLHWNIIHLVGYFKVIYLIIWNLNHCDFADDFIILQVHHFPKPNQNMDCWQLHG